MNNSLLLPLFPAAPLMKLRISSLLGQNGQNYMSFGHFSAIGLISGPDNSHDIARGHGALISQRLEPLPSCDSCHSFRFNHGNLLPYHYSLICTGVIAL